MLFTLYDYVEIFSRGGLIKYIFSIDFCNPTDTESWILWNERYSSEVPVLPSLFLANSHVSTFQILALASGFAAHGA